MTLINGGIQKVFNLDLDVKASISNRAFEVIEGDTDNYLVITLTDDGQAVSLANCRVIAVFSHSNVTALQDSAATGGGIEIADNVITLHLKTGSFSEGIVECELQIYSTDASDFTQTTTAKFNFSCRKSILSDDTVVSDMSYSALTGLIEQANSAIETANSAVTAAAQLPTLRIKYADRAPSNFETHPTLSDTPDKYIGIALAAEGEELQPSQYTWYSWKGETGNGISSASVDNSNNLIFTLDDDSMVNAGSLNGLLSDVNTSIATKASASAVTALDARLTAQERAIPRKLTVTDENNTEFTFSIKVVSGVPTLILD